MANELVIIGTGEVVDLDDAVQCAQALSGIRNLESQLREIKQALSDSIVAECSRQGTQTLDVGNGIQARLGGGTEIVWDVEVLDQLRTLGLPEERMDALITAEISYKVDTREAKRIASANPEYERVISAARSVLPKARYVTIRRQK